MSLKDKGNELFRTGKLEEAVKCYELYIQQDAKPDKKVAYTNISFCHFKMKQYKESLEAADNAIEEDQTYAKAYFRKMHAYKQMGNNDYDVYINGLLLLKYQPEAEEKIRIDTQNIMKEYKQKWMNNLNKDAVEMSSDEFIFELAAQNKPIVQQSQQLTADDWILRWSQQGVSLQSHWQQIEEQIVRNNKVGFNLAFLFLNQLKQPQYSKIYQKIKDMQNTIARKMDIESEDENQNQNEKMAKDEKQMKSESKESSSSDQNLFASPQLNHKLSSNGKELQTMKDPAIKPEITKQQQLINIKQQQLSQQLKPVKKQQPLQISSNQSVDSLYEKFMVRLNNARDVIVQLLKIVQETLSSSLQPQKKRQVIDLIRQKRQKEIKLMKTSCSKSQQQKVRDLLLNNAMEEYMPDFANRHVSHK